MFLHCYRNKAYRAIFLRAFSKKLQNCGSVNSRRDFAGIFPAFEGLSVPTAGHLLAKGCSVVRDLILILVNDREHYIKRINSSQRMQMHIPVLKFAPFEAN